jgi:hypothetical protein
MWWVGVAAAGEPVVGGTLKPVVWADLAPGDFEDEDLAEVDTWARVFANGDLGKRDRWFLDARLQHHALFGPGTDTEGGGTPVEGWWELQLGDAGFDAAVAGPVRLRGGALIERWGQMNLLPVSDVLNARDLRNGLRQDSQFQKLAAPMAVLSVADRGVRFETTWVPFPVTDRMWLRDTDWSYARQGFTGTLLNTSTTFANPGGSEALVVEKILENASLSIDDLAPQNRRNLDTSFTQSSVPEGLLYTGDLAERIELSGSRGQVALTGGWLRSRQPLSSLSPALGTMFRTETLPLSIDSLTQDGVLVVDWPRTAVAGIDGVALAGPVQVRLDSMFKTAQVVRRSWGRAALTPWLGAGVGLDWSRGSTWQVTVEARWQHLFDAPGDLMFAREDQLQLAGGVRFVTARDRLVAQVGGSFDATFVEGFLRPSLGYRVSDHVNVEVLANVLAGSTKAPLGFLEDGTNDDPVDPAFTYTGGPLSYFQQNDEIGLSIEFIR